MMVIEYEKMFRPLIIVTFITKMFNFPIMQLLEKLSLF